MKVNNTHTFGVCNICGEPLDNFDFMQRFKIHTNIGYGSKFDGENLNINICCICMDHLIERCKVSPISDNQEEEWEE